MKQTDDNKTDFCNVLIKLGSNITGHCKAVKRIIVI